MSDRGDCPFQAALRRVRLLVLDVDGVLTDGRLFYGPKGELLKAFHVRDGHGIKQVAEAGITVAIISGRKSAAVLRRARGLGIRHVIAGRERQARGAAQAREGARRRRSRTASASAMTRRMRRFSKPRGWASRSPTHTPMRSRSRIWSPRAPAVTARYARSATG